jgi:hypothetical protein
MKILILSLVIGLMFFLSAYCAWSVVRGIRSGEIELLKRYGSITVQRSNNSSRFWVAVVWNSLWAAAFAAAGLIVLAYGGIFVAG